MGEQLYVNSDWSALVPAGSAEAAFGISEKDAKRRGLLPLVEGEQFEAPEVLHSANAPDALPEGVADADAAQAAAAELDAAKASAKAADAKEADKPADKAAPKPANKSVKKPAAKASAKAAAK